MCELLQWLLHKITRQEDVREHDDTPNQQQSRDHRNDSSDHQPTFNRCLSVETSKVLRHVGQCLRFIGDDVERYRFQYDGTAL